MTSYKDLIHKNQNDFYFHEKEWLTDDHFIYMNKIVNYEIERIMESMIVFLQHYKKI